MGILDVPANYLIEEIAEKLKLEIQKPEWMNFAKTGVHNERAPQREDWFYVRMASILYRTNKWGTIGTEALRTYYGGKRNRGVKREHTYKASGKVIRTCVQTLEKTGYLKKAEPKGRKLTTKGMKILNETSKMVEEKMKQNAYQPKTKPKKAYDEKRRKEVQDTLKKQEHGKGKQPEKKATQKTAKKKEGEE
jgi:small subunit ribosomal protein S19e